MATKKKRTAQAAHISSIAYNGMPAIPKGEVFAIDPEHVPVEGMYGVSIEFKNPKEFAIIDLLNVDQSCVFHTSKYNLVHAIRLRFHKISKKRFIIKKINPDHHRIWRMKDGAILQKGGWSRKKKMKNTNES